MPSPPPVPGSANNAIVTAIVCELIICDIIPTQGNTSLAQLQTVINQVIMGSPEYSHYPVKPESSSAQEALSTCCYVRLSDEVCHLDTQPQPDLLWLWAKKIKEIRSDWGIAWSFQPWKDKKLWVRIAEVGEVTREDMKKLQAIKRECIA